MSFYRDNITKEEKCLIYEFNFLLSPNSTYEQFAAGTYVCCLLLLL